MTAAIVVAYDFSKILELEEELKVVGNNMKSLEISEQEVSSVLRCHTCTWLMDGWQDGHLAHKNPRHCHWLHSPRLHGHCHRHLRFNGLFFHAVFPRFSSGPEENLRSAVGFYGPNVHPVTRPSVSRHWRQLKALTLDWRNWSTSLILSSSTTELRKRDVHCSSPLAAFTWFIC